MPDHSRLAWLKPLCLLATLLLAALACNYTSTSRTSPTHTPRPKSVNQMACVISDVVPVRAGPGLEYEKVNQLSHGLQVLADKSSPDGQWYLIDFTSPGGSSGSGWVAAEFLALESQDLPAARDCFASSTPPEGSPSPTLEVGDTPSPTAPILATMTQPNTAPIAAPSSTPTPTLIRYQTPSNTPYAVYTPTLPPPRQTPRPAPTLIPTERPSDTPAPIPSASPTLIPTRPPTDTPAPIPSASPTLFPTEAPTPTRNPSPGPPPPGTPALDAP